MSHPPSPSSNNKQIDLTLIDEIGQSILSNLDRDSLLNSIISLLHQVFGFSKVTLYTLRGEDQNKLKKIGISGNGLEPEETYYYKKDSSPISECIALREEIVIQDKSPDNFLSPGKFDQETQSELVLPLLNGDSLIGILDLWAGNNNVFVAEVVQTFKLLAAKIATAIRNANLYRSEQLRRLVSERLQEVMRLASKDQSPDELYARILTELAAFFSYDAAGLWLLDAGLADNHDVQPASIYHLEATRYKEPEKEEAFASFFLSPGLADQQKNPLPWMSEVICQRKPLLGDNNSFTKPGGIVSEDEDQNSALAAPLILNDQVMGVIACVHHLPGQYDGESLPIIQVFSEYTSIAIENSKLFNAAHNQAWVSTVLLQVAEATQSITNLEDLLESIVEILPGLIGVSACAVFLWDPTVDDYFYHTSYGFSELQISGLKSWDIPSASVAIFKNIMENRTPIILNSDTLNSEVAEQVFPDYDLDKDLLILFPLLSQNEINGVMLIDFTNSDLNSDSPQEMWDEKYTLIEGVSRQASIAIENLQLIKSQEEEAYISVALLQVAQAVVSLKHLDEILATIVRITPILAGVKRCIIYIWENKEQVFRQSQYFGLSRTDLALMGQVVTGNEFPFIKAVQQQGRIIHHALGPEEAPASWNEIEPADYQVIEEVNVNSGEMQTTVQLDKTSFTGKERLLIGLPLSVKGENLGVMIIEEEEPLRGFTPVHIREKRLQIVKGITQQAAIAIKNELLQQEAVNSERMERELQLAREIQATFLPEIIPEIPGWDLDARWQPAREVGGDFYDIINLEGHKLGFVIADVADKGMPAALFMTLIRTLIRAAAKERSSPAAVLSQVNELLIPDAKHGMFVTVFYGVISLDTGAMVYANAGHNPPVLKPRSSKQLIELTRTSIALGIFDQIEVEEREISLNPGDWLFLYTDGITEAFSIHSEMFGAERLQRLLVDTDFISSKHLSDQVIEAVQTFIQGAELSDDMTLGVIYRKT